MPLLLFSLAVIFAVCSVSAWAKEKLLTGQDQRGVTLVSLLEVILIAVIVRKAIIFCPFIRQ